MQYDRLNSQNASTWDTWSAEKVNDINEDLDALFEKLDPRDLTLSWDVNDQLTQIVDNTNSITINIDWTSWNADTPLLFIQEVWDTKKFTITYTWELPTSVSYA